MKLGDAAMVDVKMPESQPCQFNKAWIGKCNKPTDNGWCTEHEGWTCIVCGKQAVRTCEYTGSMPLSCGAKLCADCHHEPYNPVDNTFPSKHLNKENFEEALRKAMEAEKA